MRERIRFEMEIAATLGAPEQEVLPVDRNEQVDRFLRREKSFPQWRISELIKCGAVELIRGSTRTALKKADEKIKKGDQLDLQSPLSSACQKAIDNIPETAYRDYAFANPNPADAYEKGLLEYLKLQPQTKILSVDTLSAFKRALDKGDLITHPIRNLIIASHASRMGLLALPLTFGSAKVVTFEDLQSAVNTKSLEIDPTILDPRPKSGSGSAIPPRVHIKGCNIGNTIARPFLDELKKALGGKISITAPKFFHSMKRVTFTSGGQTKLVEIWEFFSYEFVLFQTRALASKADAVKAYLAAAKTDPNMVRIDSSAVPQTDWEKWIPSTLPADGKVHEGNVAVTSTLSSKASTAGTQFRHRKLFFFGKEWQSISLTSDPGTDALRLDEIKKQLEANNDNFRTSHPFPTYARTGFKTIDDFLKSYSWKFKPFDKKKGTLAFSGTRHEYTVLAPIVDPKTNELFMNLYPVSGSPTINLLESDTRFFASV